MICSLCRKKIKVESEDFEEVGSIEFAHTVCVDKVRGEEESEEDS